MRIASGDIVVVVLHSPREKLLGVLGTIDAAGITLRSIDLGYFDDWCRAIAEGEDHLQMSDNFYPIWRVERMTRDASAPNRPSLEEQFQSRTGRKLGCD